MINDGYKLWQAWRSFCNVLKACGYDDEPATTFLNMWYDV